MGKTYSLVEYMIGIFIVASAPFLILVLALHLGEKGNLIPANILCVVSILIGMWVPGIWVSATIERRLNRIEDLLRKDKKTEESA